ncbi:MAG: serine hydrolase domain-containing protein [Pseudomonadota bacterium]
MPTLFRAAALPAAAVALGLTTLTAPIATAAAQIRVEPGIITGEVLQLRRLTLEVDPFGGEFSRWYDEWEFSDYTAVYSFRWKLNSGNFVDGEYIVRDGNDVVLTRGPLDMDGRKQGFFNLRLADLPERLVYKVSVQGLTGTTALSAPSEPVILRFAELEPVPWLFMAANLENTARDNDVPGMSTAVTCGPGHFIEWTTGVRRADSTLKVQPDDTWHIGSNTKAMTIAMLAKLVEEGHFDWDTTVWDLVYDKKLLPGGQGLFPPLFRSINQHFKDVTIDRLAAHRSGMIMPGALDAQTRAPSNYARTPTDFREDIIRQMLNRPHAGIIGEWRYGQGNYMILGHLIEKVRGKPYEQVMVEEFFGPLGMASANFGMPTDASVPPAVSLTPFNPPTGNPWVDQYFVAAAVDTTREVNGHRFDPAKPAGQRVRVDNIALPPVWNPAGGAYMTSKDFLKFARLMIDGQHGSFSLSPASIAQIQSIYMRSDRQRGPMSEPPENRADPSYGWAWGQWMDGTWGQVLGHDGSYFRFYTTTRVYVDSGFAAFSAANLEGGNNAPGDDAAARANGWLVGQAKAFCSGEVAPVALQLKEGPPVTLQQRRRRSAPMRRSSPVERAEALERLADDDDNGLPQAEDMETDYDIQNER